MAKKKPIQSFIDDEIIFEFESDRCRLLRLNPNIMEADILILESRKQQKIPFAHLPKSVKKKIRPK